jgi:TolB-like protein/tetratricopeptide (TPR) repeat protein
MVAGRPPFEAERAHAVMAKHASETAPGLRSLDPEIPLFIERAVSQALAKEPGQRFSSPGMFARTLRSETIVAAVGRKRLAVLPPVNVTHDPEQQFLVQGLHESLISELSQGDVAVLARTSVLQYEGTSKAVRDICAELSADAVVESSLFRSGESVGIRARLIDGNTEEGLWSGSYDGEIGDVLSLYREVCVSVADEILGILRPKARSSLQGPGVDPAAYEKYLRGRVFQQSMFPHELDRAMQYYEAALEIQPDHALTHAGIAMIWASRNVLGLVPPLEAGPEWRGAAERAVMLDPDHAEGHQVLAQVYSWFDYDFEKAEAAFRRSIELDPNAPEARVFFGHFLAAMHRVKESDEQSARALEIDPFNPFMGTMRGIQRGLTGRYEEAMSLLNDVAPNPLACFANAWFHLGSGETERGRALYAEYFDMLQDPETSSALRSEEVPTLGMLAGAEVLAGRSERTFVTPTHPTVLFGWAGHTERAFEWLDRCLELRDQEMVYLAVIPFAEDFRTDPRFTAMLERMKLPTGRLRA